MAIKFVIRKEDKDISRQADNEFSTEDPSFDAEECLKSFQEKYPGLLEITI
ncbi:MAG: hypothetical protein HQM09_17530 [Candidatus Riflebacteria bacterium]|nr:hypothetical protein [Candidatus Riflebacteria bacterium]